MRNHRVLALASLCSLTLAACSGGSTYSPPSGTHTQAPSTLQVVTLALPTTAIGSEIDPTFGEIGGYTQTTYSQTLAFAPGSQIMIHNGQSGVPHTLGDTGASGTFPSTQPAALSTTPSGSSTLSSGFQTGTINPGSEVGPFTLSAGTYLIGCAFHYQSNGMRDVLVVASGATPGPQASPPAGAPAPAPTSSSNPYGY